jgi:hypothetical protein
MIRYEPETPRAACGIAALLMTAVTLWVLVVVPSQMEQESQMFSMLAMSNFTAANLCAAATLKCTAPPTVRSPASSAERAPATGGGRDATNATARF